MPGKTKRPNPKRRIARHVSGEQRSLILARMGYGGNPEHKRNPGDFGLSPPSQPRPDKTLCDAVRVFNRSEALELLRAGVRRGLVSEQATSGLPQNIWSVTANGEPLEAHLENSGLGTYHGYPLLESDPFREIVIEAWQASVREDGNV